MKFPSVYAVFRKIPGFHPETAWRAWVCRQAMLFCTILWGCDASVIVTSGIWLVYIMFDFY